MSIIFYGNWSLSVVSVSAAFMERIRVSGAATGAGVVPGVAGAGIASIDGPSWKVDMEWSSDSGASWRSSALRRLPCVTAEDGLIVTLGADDNEPELRDGDYDDVVVRFVYLNRAINPSGPTNPYSYTVPRETVIPGISSIINGRKRKPCDCCSSCRCGR